MTLLKTIKVIPLTKKLGYVLRNALSVLIVTMLLSPMVSHSNDWSYTVRPGDSLWTISEKYLTKKEYATQLLKINRLKKTTQLKPGTKLKIPVKWMKHQPTSSRVIHAQGEVTIIRSANEQPKPPGEEIHLYVGDTIITGDNGSATLEFADKSRLLVQKNSELVMDTLSSYGDSGMVDTRLRLPTGRVETQVTPKKGPGSRYEITTPAATAAVRGTDFRVSADTSKSISRSEVLEGKVKISSSTNSRDIPAGFGTVTEAGKKPIPPKKLLPRPDVSNTQKLFVELPLTFSWNKVTGAKSYRAQIYQQGQFDTLLIDKQLNSNSLQLGDLDDNHYILRVRATDELGLEGLNQDHAFIVDARPYAPVIDSPANNAILRDNQPVLSWTASNPSNKYQIQISLDKQFSNIVANDEKHSGKQYQPKSKLPSTQLFWRVAALDNSEVPGPYSETGVFQIRPLPQIPSSITVFYDRKIMSFKWMEIAEKPRYHFQMATDSAFENIIIDKKTEKNHISFSRPSSNIFYYRLRAFNQQQEYSPFNKPTMIHVSPLYYNTSTSP